MSSDPKPILVIGGGIAGMTAAVEAAEVGYPVILVEKDAFLGGRVIRSNKYFPENVPAGLRLRDQCSAHPKEPEDHGPHTLHGGGGVRWSRGLQGEDQDKGPGM